MSLGYVSYPDLSRLGGQERLWKDGTLCLTWNRLSCGQPHENHMKKFCLNLTSTVWDQMQHQISSNWEAFKFKAAPSLREFLTSNTLICVFRAQDSPVTISNCHLWLVAVQSFSHILLFVTPWTAAHQAPLSFTISWSLLKLMSTESVMPSNHLILCHPLLLLPSTFNHFQQHQGLFKWASSWHQVAKVLELQLQHQSFQWIFRLDIL